MSRKLSRRRLLQTSAAAGAGVWLTQGYELPSASAALQPANNRLNIAIIGVGGQGASNLNNVAKENIVALCDVDENRMTNAIKQFPKAATYADFRVMLDKQGKEIDAVVVSTPDHTHAIASITAMRMGKHCYCEKPLTHDVWEARQMRIETAKHKVATQMGNMGTANSTFRTGVEIIRAGVIGDVREVHVWTNRPIWPQNINRPKNSNEVPKNLSWDLWLGTAPTRPYVRDVYHPFAWRGWWDFGTGALGDMACHTMNLPFMALRLNAPNSVQADVAQAVNQETAPMGCTVTYEFPARDKMPACRLLWYERRLPPNNLFQGQKPSGSGCLMIGSKGTLYSPHDYGGAYRLLPEKNFTDFKPPQPTLPRSPGHHQEWINACKGGAPAMSNFVDYASKLTETVLLGNVAIRVGKRVVWDADKLRAVDLAQADQYIRREYRKGWTL